LRSKTAASVSSRRSAGREFHTGRQWHALASNFCCKFLVQNSWVCVTPITDKQR